MRYILTFLFFVFAPLIALAQETLPPETIDQMTGYLPAFLNAVAAGDYKVMGGIVLMLGMVVVRQFVLPKARIEAAHLPFIVAAIAGLSFAGMGMLTPSVTVLEALKNGLITAFIAGGVWDLLGKYLAKLVLGDSYKEPAPKLP